MIDNNNTILLVEDSETMARIQSHILNDFGVAHDIVGDGLAAIKAAKNKRYDLILMDIMLPKMDGMEATRKIRGTSPHNLKMPIIAVSGVVSEQNRQQFLDAGLTDVMKKPVNHINLFDMLSKHLGLQEQCTATELQRKKLLDTDNKPDDEFGAINWETLKEYKALLNDDFEVLLDHFLYAGPTVVGEIGEAICENDAVKVMFITHKFKSTSMVFGAESVSNLAAQLEIFGKNNSLEQAGPIYQELHCEFELAKAQLEKRRKTMRSSE